MREESVPCAAFSVVSHLTCLWVCIRVPAPDPSRPKVCFVFVCNDVACSAAGEVRRADRNVLEICRDRENNAARANLQPDTLHSLLAAIFYSPAVLFNSGLTLQTFVLAPTIPLMLLQTSLALLPSASVAGLDLSGFWFHFSLHSLLFGSVLLPADLQVTSNTALVPRPSLTCSRSTGLRGTMWSPQHAPVRDCVASWDQDAVLAVVKQHHLHELHELQV